MSNLPKIKISEYEQFIAWSALPSNVRIPATQKELAQQLNVTEATLSHWKDKEDYPKRKMELMKKWSKDGTPDVIDALLYKAKRGDVRAIELWIKYVEEWAETQRIEQPNVIQAILQKFEIKDESRPKEIKGQSPKDISPD
jgi:transcriptional regulator with XRE-family HTH domain